MPLTFRDHSHSSLSSIVAANQSAAPSAPTGSPAPRDGAPDIAAATEAPAPVPAAAIAAAEAPIDQVEGAKVYKLQEIKVAQKEALLLMKSAPRIHGQLRLTSNVIFALMIFVEHGGGNALSLRKVPRPASRYGYMMLRTPLKFGHSHLLPCACY